MGAVLDLLKETIKEIESNQKRAWSFPKPPSADSRGYFTAFLWGFSRATWKVSRSLLSLIRLCSNPNSHLSLFSPLLSLQQASWTSLCLGHPAEWDKFMCSDQVQDLS